jgi:hypothetical protein
LRSYKNITIIPDGDSPVLKMKRIFLIALYNTAAVVLLLLFLEFLVRIFVPEIRPQGTDKNLFIDSVYSSSAGLKPDTSGISHGELLYTDKYGFRKNRTAVDTSKKSILLLGDSAAMGIGIETDSTFSSVLQDRIKSQNVLNPSMFGYNIQDYKNVFDYFLSSENLKINKVIICWCLNDIYDSSIDYLEIPGRGLRYLFSDILTYLSEKSYLYTYLKTFFTDRPKAYYLFDSNLYRNKKLIERTVSILNYINKKCVENKIKFSVLLLPYEYQLRIGRSYPQPLLEEILKRNGIDAINTSDYFKNKKK